jgi:hypothetical protein
MHMKLQPRYVLARFLTVVTEVGSGRPTFARSGRVRSVAIPLVERVSVIEERINKINLRLAKFFAYGVCESKALWSHIFC